MKRSIYWRWGLTAFLTVCAVLVFYDAFYQGGTLQQILGKLAEVLAPVFYGLAMAYLLTPLTKWFERIILWCLGKVKGLQNRQIKNGKAWLRAAAILLTWAVVLALLYWLMSVLIPQLIDSVTMLIKNARYYYYKVYRWADTWLKENPEIGSWANDMLSEYYNNAVDTLTGTILPKVQEMAAALTGGIWTGIRSVVNFAVDLIVGIIISIYLLAMKEKSLARCCKVIYATFRKETAELLLTLPITVTEALVGKFLAAWAFIGIGLALTFPVVCTAAWLGSPDLGAVFCGYVGSFLLAGAATAIGVFASSLSRSQVIGFVIALATTFLLLIIGFDPVVGAVANWGVPGGIVNAVASCSLLTHFDAMRRGVIDFADIGYYVGVMVFMLAAAQVVTDSRKAS